MMLIFKIKFDCEKNYYYIIYIIDYIIYDLLLHFLPIN